MYQARRDAAPDQVPVVMHRANNRPWLIVVEVVDLIRLLDVVDERRAKIGDQRSEGGDQRSALGEAVGQSGSVAVATTVMNDDGRA
jgi:hypothetical protein